ncbi:hypothetical protein ACRAWG_34390 [Methylobacterium sp. P31]
MTMLDFRFCVALRHSGGLLDAPVREETITAGSAAEAIEVARRIHVDMIGLDANVIYVADADGHVLWSLRLVDVWR